MLDGPGNVAERQGRIAQGEVDLREQVGVGLQPGFLIELQCLGVALELKQRSGSVVPRDRLGRRRLDRRLESGQGFCEVSRFIGGAATSDELRRRDSLESTGMLLRRGAM